MEARRAVYAAQDEAKKLGGATVSTEHLLLALLRDPESLSARVLVELGVSFAELEAAVVKEWHEPLTETGPSYSYTVRFHRLVQLAFDDARSLNQDFIRGEHLLLAMIRQKEGITGMVLSRLAVFYDAARAIIILETDPSSVLTEGQVSVVFKDIPSASKAWMVLSARRQRMTADQMCLLLLFEENGDAAKALEACGLDPCSIAVLVEEEMLEPKSVEQLKAGFLSGTDLLRLANAEAKDLGQDVKGPHFILGMLAREENATTRALRFFGATHDKLRNWIADQL